MKQIPVRLVGGPRDGETLFVAAKHLSHDMYVSAPNAPGAYWRPRGLAPLALDFHPAPGGQFVAAPQQFAPAVALCR